MWACVTISNRMWSLRPSWKVAIFLWNVPYRWRKTWAGCVCPGRNEYLLISAIMLQQDCACVMWVCRHRASLKGTQIDCLLAVSAPIWWSPKIKTSFFSSQDARRQQSSQAWFSFLSINTSHLHHSSVALFTLYRVKNGLAVDYISSVDEYLCVFDNRLIWSHYQWQSMWIPQILLYMCSHILLCGLLNYVDDHGLAMLFSTATDQSLIQMLWKIKKCTMAGWF